jgi:hypothetical protein
LGAHSPNQKTFLEIVFWRPGAALCSPLSALCCLLTARC